MRNNQPSDLHLPDELKRERDESNAVAAHTMAPMNMIRSQAAVELFARISATDYETSLNAARGRTIHAIETQLREEDPFISPEDIRTRVMERLSRTNSQRVKVNVDFDLLADIAVTGAEQLVQRLFTHK